MPAPEAGDESPTQSRRQTEETNTKDTTIIEKDSQEAEREKSIQEDVAGEQDTRPPNEAENKRSSKDTVRPRSRSVVHDDKYMNMLQMIRRLDLIA